MLNLSHTKSVDMVLVFYGFIKDFHTLNSLRKHIHLLARGFCGSGVQVWLSRVLCSVSQRCNQGLLWAMFSSEGLTAEESIFTLIQVAARTCFLWPEDSRPGFLLAAGWRPPSGCTATCSSLRLPTMLCHVGCSNLAIYFIKPLCSAR